MSKAKTAILDNLDPFTRAYIEAALWSSYICDEDGNEIEPMDSNHGPEDIAVTSLKRIISDCMEFQEDNNRDLLEADKLPHYDMSHAGHDFWLTRNRHGAGYWDSGLGKEIGDRLTNAAHAWGEIHLHKFRGKIWLE